MLVLCRMAIHLTCLSPLIWLWRVLIIGDDTALGADPIKEIEHFLGYTAMVIFCAMFLLGILLQWLKKPHYQILRRPLGLWAFVWAGLHIASFWLLELGQDVSLFLNELTRRPYLIFGGIAFLILLMMAITSLPGLKRQLGQRWFSLHQWAYLALACAMGHYYWSIKSVSAEPLVICGIVIGILVWRLFYLIKISNPLKKTAKSKKI